MSIRLVSFRYVSILLLGLLACACRPQQRNEVRVRFAADPQSLNPIGYRTFEAAVVVNLLFQSLITVDFEDTQLKPLLAESLPTIERKDSITLITYTIRKEAVWDNGTPITVHDVIFTMKAIQCPLVNNSQFHSSYDFIQDIQPDSVNLRRFTFLCRGFTSNMTFYTGDFFILPAYQFDPKGLLQRFSIPKLMREYDQLSNDSTIKAYAEFFNNERFTRGKDELHGSAGYQLDDWKTGQSLRLVKKDHWWGDPLNISHLTAKPPTINFRVIPDNTTALLELKNQQLDVLGSIATNDFLQFQKNETVQQQFDLFSPDTYEVTFFGLNGQLNKLADRKTRQALAHLVDLDNIIQATQKGFALPTIGIIHPQQKQSYNDSIHPYPYNLAKAESLLQEAGWKKIQGRWEKRLKENTVPLTLNLRYRTGNTAIENTALIFQQSAAKVGIPVELQPMEGRLLTESRKNRDFEMYLHMLAGSPYSSKLKPLFHTSQIQNGGRNDTHFGTAESDSLLEIIDNAESIDQRVVAQKRLQSLLHNESNLLFLYFNKERIAISKRFTNRKVSIVRPYYDLSAFTPQPL